MRFCAMPLLLTAAVGCSAARTSIPQTRAEQAKSAALAKPVPVPPEMERRDITEPNPYLYPERP